LKYAESLFRADRSTEGQLEAIRAQAAGRQQALTQLRQQGDAAAAKLANVLGLPPDVQLVPIDTALRPVALADAGQPTEALVAQALQAGPGVRELERMLEVIQSGIERSGGASRLLPALEVRALEGGFGAGPGASLDWDNRFNLGVQFRWSLSDRCTAHER